MDRDVARTLVENLLERSASEERVSLTGIEREALRTLLAAGGEQAPMTVAVGDARADAVPGVQAGGERHRSVSLSPTWTTRDTARGGASVVLGLDFGTALSKAFAIQKANDDSEAWFDLALGQEAGGVGYSIPSCVWIDHDGNAFVGHVAEDKHRAQRVFHADHEIISSLKQYLSHSGSQAVKTMLTPAQNPLHARVNIKVRDAITLFLAYFIDTAEAALREKLEGLGIGNAMPPVRFAVPCFETSHATEVENILRELLPRALVLADSLRNRVPWNQGIPLDTLSALLEQIDAEQSRWPVGSLLPAVQEAVAAGQGVLRTGEAHKEIAIIVDVGAGTTDFAAFLVGETEDEALKLRVLPNTVRVLKQAGDHVDNILESLIKSRHPEAPPTAFVQLGQNIRRMKETLFISADGKASYALGNDAEGTISREELLAHAGMTEFGEKLRTRFLEVLRSIDPGLLRVRPVTVVFTGGGSELPPVVALSSVTEFVGTYELKIRRAPAVPTRVRRDWDDDFIQAYPQLAVAIGAAARDAPAIGAPFATGIAPGPPPRAAKRFTDR